MVEVPQDEYVKNIAEQAAHAVLKEYDAVFTEKIDAFCKRMEASEERIIERLIEKLKPSVAKFKDEAVEKAAEQSLGWIQSTFNIDPRNSEDRKKRQNMDSWVEQKIMIENSSKITVRQAVLSSIFSKVGAVLFSFVFFIVMMLMYFWFKSGMI